MPNLAQALSNSAKELDVFEPLPDVHNIMITGGAGFMYEPHLPLHAEE